MGVNYKPSKTLVNSKLPPIQQAKQWLADFEGEVSYNLSQGVPIDPPPLILQQELSRQSITSNVYQYGDISGQSSFKKSFLKDLNNHYKSSLSTDKLLITPGANAAFYTTILALTQFEENNNVILQSPFYFNHEMTLSQLNVKTKLLDCQSINSFIPVPDDLTKLIDENTRAVVLVTPNNPTGVSIPSSVLEECLHICSINRIPLILDETYRSFCAFTKPHSLYSKLSNLISLHSFSKDLAIPGLRLGSIVAQDDFIHQCLKIADCYQISSSNLAQSAIAPIYEDLNDFKLYQKKSLAEKHSILRSLIDELDRWQITSSGAYYAFIRYPFPQSSVKIASVLANKFGVLTLPGSFFTTDDKNDANYHLRISVANVTQQTLIETKQRWLDFDRFMKT